MIEQQKKTIEVNYGLASSYDNVIEINKKLSGTLKESILKHEARHRTGSYKKEDFLNDFQAEKPNFFESFKFCLKNKEALIGYFPFMYSYYFKKMTYNSSSLYPVLYFGIIFSIFFLVLFKINIFLSFLGWVIIFLSINALLLFITHRHIKKCGVEY